MCQRVFFYGHCMLDGFAEGLQRNLWSLMEHNFFRSQIFSLDTTTTDIEEIKQTCETNPKLLLLTKEKRL